MFLSANQISKKETRRLFSNDENRRAQWIRTIPVKDFTPSLLYVVCVKHFSKQFDILKDSTTRGDGTLTTVPRG